MEGAYKLTQTLLSKPNLVRLVSLYRVTLKNNQRLLPFYLQSLGEEATRVGFRNARIHFTNSEIEDFFAKWDAYNSHIVEKFQGKPKRRIVTQSSITDDEKDFYGLLDATLDFQKEAQEQMNSVQEEDFVDEQNEDKKENEKEQEREYKGLGRVKE
ncbi:hypothetical protein FGO68_gene2516 [Halteria grandinella]|uniref:Uncharacterized protein n=1 Tax=Halteria grandinella TaxID=5974 RepID=A0A8J8P723_HALGN|nr:hypothetical protein FGO68_gene2516 [Halteria grandinella]